MSLEFVTTCGRRSSDPSTALVYWRGPSSPTSLLIDNAAISKRWKDITSRRVGSKSKIMTTSGRRSSDPSTALI